MKTYEVSQNQYHYLRGYLAGSIFHRVDELGCCLVKPFGKFADRVVRTLDGREVFTS